MPKKKTAKEEVAVPNKFFITQQQLDLLANFVATFPLKQALQPWNTLNEIAEHQKVTIPKE